MKKFHLLILSWSISILGFSQNDLAYTLMDQFDLGFNLLFSDDTNILVKNPNGGYTTVSYNLPKTTVSDGTVHVRTFDSQGHAIDKKINDLGDEPFNGQYYIGTIINEGKVLVITSPERTNPEGYGGIWTFWKLEGINFTKHKDLKLEDGDYRLCTNVYQSENRNYTLLEINAGDSFILLNKDLEIEGDYEFLGKDNDRTKNFIKVDNIIIDNSGNIGLSILAVGMVRQWALGVERGKAFWMLGVINHNTKKLQSFDATSVIKQETYTESISRFIDLNENEFLFVNKGNDIIRIDKKNGELAGQGVIDIEKYCIIDEKRGVYEGGLEPIQLERIDDNTICILLKSSGQVAFQMLVANVNGEVISANFLSPPMGMSIKDQQATAKNQPYILVEKTGIRTFTRLGEAEAEAIRSENFKDKKIKYDDDRLIYEAFYDLKGVRKSFEVISESRNIKCQQVSVGISFDRKSVQLSFGDGGKMRYLIAPLN